VRLHWATADSTQKFDLSEMISTPDFQLLFHMFDSSEYVASLANTNTSGRTQ